MVPVLSSASAAATAAPQLARAACRTLGAAAPPNAAAAAQQQQQQQQGHRRGMAGAAVPRAGSLLEIREYTLHPAGVKDYLALTAQTAELRGRLLPFLGMFTCDTGGELNKVTHLYVYESMGQREAVRAAAQASREWTDYVDAGRQYMQKQESRIMLEAAQLYAATGTPGAAAFAPPPGPAGMYELRQYQLHPGYGSVPKLLKAFEEGLPDKIAADRDGRLVAFAHSDVGMLNNVVELWRYPSAAACIRARQAARSVPKWRETIGAVTPGVQFFTTSFMQPCKFSPWQ